MAPPELLHSVADERPAPPRGVAVGRLVFGLIALALVGWTGVRVRTALREQGRLLTERTQAAEAAKKERRDKPLVLAVGVPATWRPLIAVEGTLHAAEEADLAFRAQGRLHAIRAKVGDYVKKGQVLATLEQTEPAAALDQARAQLRAAEAQRKLAEDSEQRTTALLSSGAGSAQAALQTQQQHALALAQADAARAALALAQANVENATLVAPFSGYVTKVPTGAGQVVAPGATLFHLQDTAQLKLAGTISEADAGLVRPGEALRVLGPAGPVKGTVSAVLASVDPSTRRVPLEARVPNDAKPPLLAGSYARAEIDGDAALPVLRFPAGVIRPGSQSEVMVVDAGRMHARTVVFHPAPEGTIWVSAGLGPHDQVVVDPSPEAKDGDAVPAARAP